jgi:drug/metabolite transporter (DMT)-like permease
VTSTTSSGSSAANARLMLVLLCLGWGLSWSAMRLALTDIPPFSMRVVTMGLGAATLGVITALRRRPFALRSRKAAAHVFAAALFNIVAFSVLTPFAQLYGSTSRVAILVYTMPIWACLFARVVLGERIAGMRAVALGLCVAGMVALIYPLAHGGIPIAIVLSLGAAVSWAAGTIYLKWAHIEADPIAVTFWQLLIGFILVGICQPIVEGPLHLWPMHPAAIAGLLFAGFVGSGIAYFLWFDIVRRLPAVTASLGVLGSPAIGVIGAVVLLGERPTLPDIIGFAMILAASACVLLAPGGETEMGEPA